MDPLQKCLQTAKSSGVSEEQARSLLSHGYVPFPWQWEFHAVARLADEPDGPVDIGTGGARGPGKSHAVLSQAALDDCQRIPKLKGLFLRQTGTAAKESFEDLVYKVLAGKIGYKHTGSSLTFENGSKIILGGFRTAGDIDKYIGIEYDFIIIEELNQLTEEKHTKLRGSLRTSKTNWRPRLYTSFNPGGIGHAFVKERYITPFREKREKDTKFIGSTYLSNPFLNREYIQYLEDLKGDLGRAWREGDWDLFEGQVFSEFRREIHVKRPFTPKSSFAHFLGSDWGYSGREADEGAFATVAGALAKQDHEGVSFNRVIIYKEWYGKYKSPDEWAEEIYNDSHLKYNFGVADSAMFNTQTDGSAPISELMMKKWDKLHGSHWLELERGTRNRIARVATLHNWLTIAPDGLPYLIITDNCKHLARTIPMLIHDERRVEDVDTTGEDHLYDCTTYALSNIHWIPAHIGYVAHKSKVRKGLPALVESLDLKEFENAVKSNKDWRA